MRGTGTLPGPLACVAREKGRKVILNAKKIPGDRSRCRECNMRGTGAFPVPLACVARVKKKGGKVILGARGVMYQEIDHTCVI